MTKTTPPPAEIPSHDRDFEFTAFGLHQDLLRGIAEMGFSRPTPIQRDAIPPALAGRDILACAMTGSGKTAAFLLPILENLRLKRRRTTRALILTPTRELAAQIAEHLESLAIHTSVSGAPVFGGVGMGPQEHAFRIGVDVIVATPGRLLDHFQYPYAKLSGVEILVLDEADRMLDMGFLPDIRRVLQHLPAKRQTLFFSATMPSPIVTLANEILKDPVAIRDMFEDDYWHRPEFVYAYRHRYGFHGTHPIILWGNTITFPKRYLGRIIFAGARNPDVVRHMGFESVPTLEDAFREAENQFGPGYSITYQPIPPLSVVRVS